MSYFEYYDMFEKSQETGKYHMFIFDIVGSRNYKKDLPSIYKTSKVLFSNIYSNLKEIELERSIKILHIIDKKEYILDTEPFQFGDLFGFTILRDSILIDEVYDIYKKEKEKLNVYWDFHLKNGYYETDNYGLGNEKYFRGYCIQQLENLSKNDGKNLKLDKKKKC